MKLHCEIPAQAGTYVHFLPSALSGGPTHPSAAQPTSFTMGQNHDEWGLVYCSEYLLFRDALNAPDLTKSDFAIAGEVRGHPVRWWECPPAGRSFDEQYISASRRSAVVAR